MRKILIAMILFMLFLIPISQAKPYESSERYGCFEVTWKGSVGVVQQNYKVIIRELCGYNRYIYPTVVVDNFKIDSNKIKIVIKRIKTEQVYENTTIPVVETITFNYSQNPFTPTIFDKNDLILYPNCKDDGNNETFSCEINLYENATELVETQTEKNVDYVVERYDSLIKAKVTEPIFVKANGETVLRVKVKYKHAVKHKKKWIGGRVGIVIDGHLYHPWWDTSWQYRKMMVAKNYISAPYNYDTNPFSLMKTYLINVTKMEGMLDDYSDVRFTSIDAYLNEEELPYKLVYATDDWALFAVKIYPRYNAWYSTSSKEDLLIYMYYGNQNPPPSDYEMRDVFHGWTGKELGNRYRFEKSFRSVEDGIVFVGYYGRYVYVHFYDGTDHVTTLTKSGAYYCISEAVCANGDYIYVAYNCYAPYTWRGYVAKIYKPTMTLINDTYVGSNLILRDIYCAKDNLYVFGSASGGVSYAAKLDDDLNMILHKTYDFAPNAEYPYWHITNTNCSLYYGYYATQEVNYKTGFICFDDNLNITYFDLPYSDVRAISVKNKFGKLYVALSDNTLDIYYLNFSKVRSIPLSHTSVRDIYPIGDDSIAYRTDASLCFFEFSGDEHCVSITGFPANTYMYSDIEWDNGDVMYSITSSYVRYALKVQRIISFLRTNIQFTPSISWNSALPVWVYNNNTVNYTNVVVPLVLNVSNNINCSDILVTKVEDINYYIPYVITECNDSVIKMIAYLGNVSAYENVSMYVWYNKTPKVDLYFLNNSFFTYPIYGYGSSISSYCKGISPCRATVNVVGISNGAETLLLKPPFIMEWLVNDFRYYLYVDVYGSTLGKLYTIKYTRSQYVDFTIYNESGVACSISILPSPEQGLHLYENLTLVAWEGDYKCSVRLPQDDSYYLVFNYDSPSNAVTLKYIVGYSYLTNYIVDPPVNYTYELDVETLNNPPEIFITSPKPYSYYNAPMLTFSVTDDLSDYLTVEVLVDNVSVYANTSYINGSTVSLDLRQYINQSYGILHVVQVVAYDGASYTYSDEIPFYYAPFEFYTTMKSDFIEKYDYQQINLSTTLVNTTNFIIEWWYSDFDTTYAPQNDTVVPNCSLPWCNATYEIPCTQNSFVYFNAYVTNGTNTYKAGPFSYICGGLPASVGVTTPTPVQTAGGGLSPNTDLDVKSFAIKVPEGQCVDDVLVVELKHDWFTYNATLKIYDLPSNMIFYPSNMVIKPGSNLIGISICGVETGDYAGRAVVTLENGIEDSAEIAVHVRSFSQSLMEMARSWWVWLIVLVGLVLWHKGKT